MDAIVIIDDENIRTVVDPAEIVDGSVVIGPTSATDGHLAVFDGATGKVIKDGGAPGGGGSFLSANTARVDPSGSDETGTVGDLNKPFLTVQAAIDALVAADLTSGVIDLGANDFDEDVVADLGEFLVNLKIIGNAPSSNPYNYLGSGIKTLTITRDGVPNIATSITISGCAITQAGGGITVTSDLDGTTELTLFLENASVAGEVNASGAVKVISNSQSGMVGGVTAGDDTLNTIVTVQGLVPIPGGALLLSGLGGQVNISRCRPYIQTEDFNIGEYQSLFSAQVPPDESQVNYITVFESVIGSITARDAWLVDSRAIGTINVDNPIQYADILLKGVPPGGTTGQALEKASNDDFDTSWESLV